MEKYESNIQADSALLSFLHSATETEAENTLEILVNGKIQPTIENTIRAKLHVSLKADDFTPVNQDGLELCGEVKYLIVSELRKLKSNRDGKTIQNLKSYTISVALNAYRQYLRDKYPRRQHLKNKLRYLLTHHPKFAFWQDERGWLCGFENYKNHETAELPDAETICAGIFSEVSKKNLRDGAKLIDLLRAVFEFAKVPVAFNDLLSIVAEIQNVKDAKVINEDEISSQSEQILVTENKTLSEIEQRQQLKIIWAEIRELPLRHRAALLLNLKDKQGDCLIRLFPLLRVASIRQIAETLEFSPDEFACVWRELPWDDLRIAGYLGLTRQQVINLRQSARARLARQIKII